MVVFVVAACHSTKAHTKAASPSTSGEGRRKTEFHIVIRRLLL